jgi:hypothetical protein
VQKTRPLKKIKETDAIFDNVRRENQAADDDPDVIRISMDAKAKVAVGDYSRDGESRGAEPTKALDHDPEPEQKLVPQGILDVTSCLLSIFIAISNGTSDFFADCLEQWWEANKGRYPHGRRLVINLGNRSRTGRSDSPGERRDEPSRLPQLQSWRGFALINWCWGPVWERVRHGSSRGRLQG